MHITHVVRRADHISNTPKQILLYQALGAEQPIFAHLPLILGPDKTRMSKRHGATSVMAYKEQGILPEAFCNFLALLGWAPGDDREMFDMNELIAGFSMKGISKANAVFNPEKLSWFNAQYMQKLPTDVLIGHLRPEFQKAGIWRDSFDGQEREWLGSLLEQLRPRAKNLVEMTRQARVYILDSVEFDPVAVEKSLKDPAIRSHLSTLADRLESAADFRHETIEGVMRGLAAELGIKPGVLMGASRVALTGQTASPGIFEVISILGRDKTIARLRAVRNL
jgi:glutamyl-tRNA synthetase